MESAATVEDIEVFHLVDVREPSQYNARHVACAPNIPLTSIRDWTRLSELPAKPVPFALVVDKEELHAPTQLLCECLALLRKHTWTVVAVCSTESVPFAIPLDSAGQLLPGRRVRLQRSPSPSLQLVAGPEPSARCWQPSAFLQRTIDRIESALGGPGVAYDCGCGKGRDAAFLTARGWFVIGLDNRAKLLRQAQSISRHHSATSCFMGAVCTNVATSWPLRTHVADLVIAVRFLHRPAMASLFDLPSRFLLVSHFIGGDEAELHHGELAELAASSSRPCSTVILEEDAHVPFEVRPMANLLVAF